MRNVNVFLHKNQAQPTILKRERPHPAVGRGRACDSGTGDQVVVNEDDEADPVALGLGPGLGRSSVPRSGAI